MRAIVFDRFGGPDVPHEADIEVPQPGPGGEFAGVAAGSS